MIRLVCFVCVLFLSSCRPHGQSSLPRSCASKLAASSKTTATPASVKSSFVEPAPEEAKRGPVQEDFLICLDPGHGGQDPGTRRKKPPLFIEKQLSLSVTLQVERALKNLGYQVVLTRRKDITVPLFERVHLAQKRNALLFVSVHFNWTKNALCRGVELYFFNKKNDLRAVLSRKAAEKINQQIVLSTPFPSRGVRHGNFCVIRETAMPAVLVEAGFFSNPQDVRLLRKPAHRMALASAIARGIDEFCRMER